MAQMFQHVSQEVAAPGVCEPAPSCYNPHAFPQVKDTDELIKAKLTGFSTDKGGKDKLKIFPLAAYLHRMRKVLQEGKSAKCPEGENPTKFANFKHDVLRHYRLSDTGAVLHDGHEGEYQIPREKVHQVLVWAHNTTKHGGRDKMHAVIREHYETGSLAKDFLTKWVAKCPVCAPRKKGKGRQQIHSRTKEPRLRTVNTTPAPPIGHPDTLMHALGPVEEQPLPQTFIPHRQDFPSAFDDFLMEDSNDNWPPVHLQSLPITRWHQQAPVQGPTELNPVLDQDFYDNLAHQLKAALAVPPLANTVHHDPVLTPAISEPGPQQPSFAQNIQPVIVIDDDIPTPISSQSETPSLTQSTGSRPATTESHIGSDSDRPVTPMNQESSSWDELENKGGEVWQMDDGCAYHDPLEGLFGDQNPALM